MARLVVLAEALAVVADHDDEALVTGSCVSEPVQQPPDLLIDICQCAVVGVRHGVVRRRRFPRQVHVVVVHPQEERRPPRRGNPCERTVRHVLALPPRDFETEGVVALDVISSS